MKIYFSNKNICLTKKQNSFEAIGQLCIVFFLSLIASSFIIFKIGLILSLSFSVTSYMIAGAITPIFFFIIINIYKKKSLYLPARHNFYSYSFIFCVLASGFLAISINRYSADDGYYLAKASYYLNSPNSILDRSVPWIIGIPEGTTFPRFQYYEAFQATLAWLFGLNLLTVAHIGFPFIVGAMGFLAIYLLLGIFETREVARLLGSVVIILMLLLLGDSPRSFGTFSLTRLHQGKGVLFYFGFFCWVYFSLKFWETSSQRNFLTLVIVSVALCALSTTSFIFLPLLSVILYFSFFGSRRILCSWQAIKKGAIYAVALVPLCVQAIDFKLSLLSVHSTAHWNSKFPIDFWEQVELVTGGGVIIPLLFFCSFAFVLRFSAYRKFFCLWISLVFCFVLNPLVSPIFMENVAGSSVYWRLAFLLPFPLIVVIACLCYFDKPRYSVSQVGGAFFLIICLVFFSPTSIFNGNKYTTIELPRYKLTPVAIEILERMHQHFEPGSMVTNEKLFAVPFTIFSSSFPQLVLDPKILVNLNSEASWRDEAWDRWQAHRFLYGNPMSEFTEDENRRSFDTLLKKHHPNYVMQDIELENVLAVEDILKSNGYVPAKKRIHPSYMIWLRKI